MKVCQVCLKLNFAQSFVACEFIFSRLKLHFV